VRVLTSWTLPLVVSVVVASPAAAARPPLDVIVVVDTSGSMDAEAAEVQSGLNTFATILQNKGYDLHLILIADATICAPAPLGSGNCIAGDQNLPGYRHVLLSVGSNDSLDQVLASYPQYSASLRPGSRRVFLEVSDDDSDLSASNFAIQLIATDAGFVQFQFHAIVASTNPAVPPPGNVCNPGGFSPLAAAEGAVYKQLVLQTGGAFYDLCLQDFAPAWPEIAKAIAIFLDGFESP
jgi:hypothetical protein